MDVKSAKFSEVRPSLFLLLTIILWYGFSSANVLASKKLTKDDVTSIPLIIASILFGQYICASFCYIKQLFFGQVTFVTKQDFLIGAFYFCGNLTTLVSLALTSVSLNQVIKCLEPIFTVALSAVIFKNYQDCYQNFYMCVAVFGACISAFSDLQFAWSAIILACLSNLAFSSRNVYLKFAKIKQSEPSEQLGRISFCCLLFTAPGWLILISISTNHAARFLTNSNWLKVLFYASSSHALYNFLSLKVLSQVENAVSHGLLNILKRPLTIISSAFILEKGFDLNDFQTRLKLLGIFILVVAQFFYRLKLKPFQEKSQMFTKKVAIVLIILLVAGTSILMSSYHLNIYRKQTIIAEFRPRPNITLKEITENIHGPLTNYSEVTNDDRNSSSLSTHLNETRYSNGSQNGLFSISPSHI